VTITVTDVADTPPGQPAAPTFTSVQETRFRVVWTAPAAGSSAADTPPGKPDAPTFSDVQETQITGFRVVWAAPTAGSSAITGYGIQYKLSSESDDAYADVSPTPRGTTRGYNVIARTGQFIVPGTSYDVRVREQNAEGWGEWSDPGTVTTAGTAPAADTPPGKPDAPTFSDVQETQFRVVWAAPTAGSSATTPTPMSALRPAEEARGASMW
jgi:hypothetical protein